MKVTKTALPGVVIIEPRVFDNHRGRPTFARRIAEVISKVIDHRQSSGPLPCGIYHRISSGKTSWFGFVQENFLRVIAVCVLEKALRLRPITIEQYPKPAARSKHFKLDTSKLEQVLQHTLPEGQSGLKNTIN